MIRESGQRRLGDIVSRNPNVLTGSARRVHQARGAQRGGGARTCMPQSWSALLAWAQEADLPPRTSLLHSRAARGPRLSRKREDLGPGGAARRRRVAHLGGGRTTLLLRARPLWRRRRDDNINLSRRHMLHAPPLGRPAQTQDEQQGQHRAAAECRTLCRMAARRARRAASLLRIRRSHACRCPILFLRGAGRLGRRPHTPCGCECLLLQRLRLESLEATRRREDLLVGLGSQELEQLEVPACREDGALFD